MSESRRRLSRRSTQALDRAPSSTPTGCCPRSSSSRTPARCSCSAGWTREALRRTLTEGRVTFWSRSPPGVLAQGRHVAATRSTCAAPPSTATPTPCSCSVEQIGAACHTGAHTCFDVDPLDVAGIPPPTDDPTTRDRCHATTTSFDDFDARLLAGHRVVPGHARALRRRRDARRHLPQARGGPPGHLPARVGRAGRHLVAVLVRRRLVVRRAHRSATTRVAWLDYGARAERALGDAADARRRSPPSRQLFERWTHRGRRRAPAAHRRTRRLHRLGGDPADRAPAEPAAGRLPVPGQALQLRLRARRDRPPHGHGAADRHRCSTTADERADALWADAQARLDRMQQRLAQPSEAWLAEVDLTTRRRRRRSRTRDAPTSSPPSSGRRSTSATATSSRSSSRSASSTRLHGATRSTCTGCCAASTRARTCTCCTSTTPAGEPYWIVGSSPEALVKVQDGRVFTHPIAGSKPRGATPEARRRPRGRAARRPQGAGRAPHARRPRPQRPRQGLHAPAPSR